MIMTIVLQWHLAWLFELSSFILLLLLLFFIAAIFIRNLHYKNRYPIDYCMYA